MFSMIFGIVSAALAALGSFGSSMAEGNNQRRQAANLEMQAQATRRNARIEGEKARAAAYEKDRERRQLRREYTAAMGHNRVSLGAGNVDMASGSALDVAEGNINSFASDMGDNAYARAMTLWEGREKQKSMNWQADVMDSNASYLRRTASNLPSSLLTAGLSGAGGFATGYTLAGGSLSKLFGFGETSALWDKETPAGLLMRHPSGKWALAPK